MFDFVQPTGTGRWGLRWRRQTWLDDPQPRGRILIAQRHERLIETRAERVSSHCGPGHRRPLYAQRQQQNVAKLKADAQKVVSIIGGDEAKTETYCGARDIATQIVQAAQQEDNEKVEELSDKLIEQQKNLGSEYLAPMKSLRDPHLTSKDDQEIESMFDTLDESCPH